MSIPSRPANGRWRRLIPRVCLDPFGEAFQTPDPSVSKCLLLLTKKLGIKMPKFSKPRSFWGRFFLFYSLFLPLLALLTTFLHYIMMENMDHYPEHVYVVRDYDGELDVKRDHSFMFFRRNGILLPHFIDNTDASRYREAHELHGERILLPYRTTLIVPYGMPIHQIESLTKKTINVYGRASREAIKNEQFRMRAGSIQIFLGIGFAFGFLYLISATLLHGGRWFINRFLTE